MHSRPLVLLGLALGVGVVTAAVFGGMLNRGLSLPVGGYDFGLASVVICGFAGWLGWHVKRFKSCKKTWITAVGASRVAALALALSHVGAILGGFFGGQTVNLLLHLTNEALEALLGAKIMALGGAVLMVITGILVEKICTINPNDPKSPPPSGMVRAPA